MTQAWLKRAELASADSGWVAGGDWTIEHYVDLYQTVTTSRTGLTGEVPLDWSQVRRLDTAGAALLVELLGPERARQHLETDQGLAPERRALLDVLATALARQATPAAVPRRRVTDVLASLGAATERGWHAFVALAGFLGQILETGAGLLGRPRRWRVTAVTAHVQRVGVNAIPIVALLCFMVGAVVAFLGATVLANFGASVFSVHLVAFSFMREFGVLLAAILVAGRTASAYTAQIGSMKANEEIDALRAGGLSPLELLVLPRVLALLVALPMLTLVGMLSGVVGGATVCALSLDIAPTQFFAIMQESVAPRHYFVGLAKAPLFALMIAAIGCHEGFKVSGSAESVGEHTTSAVVQSIFVVILIDAMAALFFMEMGW
ncbi:TPA: ABC transporter permease [Pseudomonas aeruginosa]|nr:ABC transporter permease [Pseudomonas aeruginosa]